MGGCNLIQAAIPQILENTPKSFSSTAVTPHLEKNSELCYNILGKCLGLSPIKPKGGMFIMVGVDLKCFPQFKSTEEYVKCLMKEESVLCLPGEVIGCLFISNMTFYEINPRWKREIIISLLGLEPRSLGNFRT